MTASIMSSHYSGHARLNHETPESTFTTIPCSEVKIPSICWLSCQSLHQAQQSNFDLVVRSTTLQQLTSESSGACSQGIERLLQRDVHILACFCSAPSAGLCDISGRALSAVPLVVAQHLPTLPLASAPALGMDAMAIECLLVLLGPAVGPLLSPPPLDWHASIEHERWWYHVLCESRQASHALP